MTAEGATTLITRLLFFFLAAILVNRFVIENKKQVRRYQELSETLEETNRQLRRAEADARRSERLAALGQMSAGLAHEIRNPLGVIKGSAEMLAAKLQDAQPLVSELAGYISSEVNRLNALVSRFLDFARPMSVQLQPHQITDIVERSIEAVENHLPEAGVRIERSYAAGLPEVPVDEQLCESVFVNLITNAFQAMGSAARWRQGASRFSDSGIFCRPGGNRSGHRRQRPGRRAGTARTDFQSVLHFKERRRGPGAFHRGEDCG